MQMRTTSNKNTLKKVNLKFFETCLLSFLFSERFSEIKEKVHQIRGKPENH